MKKIIKVFTFLVMALSIALCGCKEMNEASSILAAPSTQTAGQTAQQQPPQPPPKPEWYWVGEDLNAKEYKWRLQYYANTHKDSTTKQIMSDLNDMRIGEETHGDFGGHIADATATLDFANGEVTRMKVDTLLTLMKQITQIDSAGVFKAYFNDHYDELMGKQKK